MNDGGLSSEPGHQQAASSDAARVLLAPNGSSAAAARRFVSAALADWAMTELQDKATLVASELVGNAVLHAKTSIELRIQPTGGLLRIEVRDTSPRLPLRRMFSAEATTGRGLSLVDRLSEQWGVIPASDGRGKTVWAVIGPADEEEDETEQFFGGRWDVDLDDVTGHAPDAAPAVPANRSTVPAA